MEPGELAIVSAIVMVLPFAVVWSIARRPEAPTAQLALTLAIPSLAVIGALPILAGAVPVLVLP